MTPDEALASMKADLTALAANRDAVEVQEGLVAMLYALDGDLGHALAPKVLAKGWLDGQDVVREPLCIFGEEVNAVYKVYEQARLNSCRLVLIVEAPFPFEEEKP